MINVGIPKETQANETRVAAVPDTVAKMLKADMTVTVESDAGIHSYIENKDYEQAGAKITENRTELFSKTNLILNVTRPSINDIELMQEQTTVIAPFYAMQNTDLIAHLNRKKITAFSLDFLPRIARAQSMDILSSMSNLAGYKSVVLAADHLSKIFPMLTTAAGTIQPAKIIIIGAGVAGLQAIATARRLGGVVIAFDTRPVVEEQVKSLGADFVSLETSHEQTQDTGGYAKEQSVEFYKNEQDIISKYIKEADVIITTALIPGKRAPQLITEDMVKMMKHGSVIVDLAAEQHGNCVLTEPGKTVVKHGINIIGLLNLPATLPANASQLYSRNVFSFLNYIKEQLISGQFDMTDEIIKSCLITHHGETIHSLLKGVSHA